MTAPQREPERQSESGGFGRQLSAPPPISAQCSHSEWLAEQVSHARASFYVSLSPPPLSACAGARARVPCRHAIPRARAPSLAVCVRARVSMSLC